MTKVKIILVDWIGYPLYRRRRLGLKKFRCGLARILKNIGIHDPGLPFDLHVVINGEIEPAGSLVEGYLNKTWLGKKGFQFRDYVRSQLLVRKKNKYLSLQEKHPHISTLDFRSNLGRDIGAYNHGVSVLMEGGYEGDVLFINTNVRGPVKEKWLVKYHDLFHQSDDIGLCGISMNSHGLHGLEFTPHVQSFFLYTNTKIVKKIFPNGFPGVKSQIHKDDLITNGEIGISTAIINGGYGITSIAYPNFVFKKDESWEIPTGDLRRRKDYQEFVNLV